MLWMIGVLDMNFSKDILYVGVDDHITDLFEGQYIVPNGMAYNSYVIVDEQIAVMDSVDARFADVWLGNISAVLGDKIPAYLVVQHMEPDHSGSIVQFMEAYPTARVVASARALQMMKGLFGTDFADRGVAVGEGDTLTLGHHTLSFITAPMVHWPEVIMSYEVAEKVLFSADAFGKFGALDADEEWACEARRYYFGIVGKFGAQVQQVLKKAASLDIATICPLHGPVLTENLGYYIDLYDTWSSYAPEEEGVFIAYSSIYGNTKAAAMLLYELLAANGCPRVTVSDLAREDWAEAVEDAFRYSKLVLATTTYNGDIFPCMRAFLDHLKERGYCNRTVAFMENGSWAPTAARKMREMLDGCKNLTFAANTVKILSALNADSTAQIHALANELWKK